MSKVRCSTLSSLGLAKKRGIREVKSAIHLLQRHLSFAYQGHNVKIASVQGYDFQGNSSLPESLNYDGMYLDR